MTLKIPVFAAAAAAAVVFAAVPAGAQQSRDGVWQRLADGGSITIEEIRANSSRAFAALDANGDGIVTRQEFIAQPLPSRLGDYANQPDLRGDLYDRIDLDSDGSVEAAEWNEALREDMSIADRNDDGTVTLDELASADLGSIIADFFD